jgi:hypothetical protein
VAVVLQEFLVSIAATLDRPSLDRALAQIPQGIVGSVQGNQQRYAAAARIVGERIGTVIGNAIVVSATSAVRDLQNLFAGMTRIAERAARSITYSVIGAATNFGILAHRLDELNAVSARTGASASNIKALDLAIRMIGGTSGDAMGAIEGLAGAMRENPGVRNYLRGLGVTETKDTVRMVEELSAVLRRDTESTAIQRGAVLGLSPEAVRLIRDGRLVGQVKEARAIFQSMGVDYDRLARDGKTWTDQWRILLTYIDAFNSKVMGAFLNPELIGQINQLIKDFGGPLSDALAEFAKSVVTFLNENANEVIKWLRDKDTPKNMVAAFEKMKDFAIEIKDAIVIIAKTIKSLYDWLTNKDPFGAGAAVTGAMSLWNDPRGTISRWLGGGGGGAGVGNGGAEGIMVGGGSGATPPAAPADTRNFWQRYAPKILGGQDAPGAATGGEGDPTNSRFRAPGYVHSKSEVRQMIDEEAAARGIPAVPFHAISSVEGGNKYSGDYDATGKPTSFGPFQLHVGAGAIGRNTAKGLGDDFKRETGLDPSDPKTVRAQIQWQMNKAIELGAGFWGHYHGLGGRNFGALSGTQKPVTGEGAATTPAATTPSAVIAAPEGYKPAFIDSATGKPMAPDHPALAPLREAARTAGRVINEGAKSFAGSAAASGLATRSVTTTRFAPDGSPVREGAGGFDPSRFDAVKSGRGTGGYDFSKANVVSPSSVNDNSKKIEFKPQYNTDIYATDVKEAKTQFQRAHEQMNDLGLRQLGGWSR